MRQRWEDWINFAFGIWLFLSPWFLNYTLSGEAWNAHITGIAFVVFALWALSAPRPWEEWINTVISVWLIISPWIIGFSSPAVPWNSVIVGVIVLVISLEATRPSRQSHAMA
ncbi:MAG: SPW repeat protein [Gammaproteobacteria bacterium]|jgi:hypothetical protein